MGCLIGSRFGFGNNILERSILEIRRCSPVLLYRDGVYALVFAGELLEESSFSTFVSFSDEVYLLLTANRMSFLSGKAALTRVRVDNLSLHEVRSIVLSCDNMPDISKICYSSSNVLDSIAIEMIKKAKLMPSALIIDMKFNTVSEMHTWCAENNVLSICGSVISDYSLNYMLEEICSSDLFLQNSLKAKIFVYRSNVGEPEHYAIVIGDPQMDNVSVRIHSSCYTGDLLGSLSCDCRGQLLSAVRTLADSGGGLILYISQEGRGIGLANKIRTYSLQHENMFDTVDANRFLGFDDDEREFLPAAMILKNLGVHRLQLLTCNPSKVSGLETHGLVVTKTIPFSVEDNKYNRGYLKTKRERMGHVN
ncbi:GTP cyclohydrolase II [Anaplasma bovis]|uniref:GTP cyclohydrolase II n=1 Tax=Anaplasma bovis TaxID=186733 RepID=UPI002FEE9B20